MVLWYCYCNSKHVFCQQQCVFSLRVVSHHPNKVFSFFRFVCNLVSILALSFFWNIRHTCFVTHEHEIKKHTLYLHHLYTDYIGTFLASFSYISSSHFLSLNLCQSSLLRNITVLHTYTHLYTQETVKRQFRNFTDE